MNSNILSSCGNVTVGTIEAAQRRVNIVLSEHIKYYEVTFCCIHGGKKFKARGEGKRSSL